MSVLTCLLASCQTTPVPNPYPEPFRRPVAASPEPAPGSPAPQTSEYPAPGAASTNRPPPLGADVERSSSSYLTNLLSSGGWVAWESWSETNGWGKPQRLRHLPTWTFELRNTNGVFELTAGSRTVVWNGLNLELGFVPQLTNGQPYVHSLDLAKTFEPLTLKSSCLARSGRTVVIDPGHGGENTGAKSILSGRSEKEFTLDWARRLEPLLKGRGWRVFLTRTNDVDLSLAERVAFADAVKADLFISLHFNSTDQPQARSDQGGVETYCLTPVGMPSTLTRQFDDESSRVYPNHLYDSENFYFAARLHRALVEATRRRDRGVRRARFMTVLREQNRPAVLLEGGYLSNPAEARLIATWQYRQKLAAAVAKALAE